MPDQVRSHKVHWRDPYQDEWKLFAVRQKCCKCDAQEMLVEGHSGNDFKVFCVDCFRSEVISNFGKRKDVDVDNLCERLSVQLNCKHCGADKDLKALPTFPLCDDCSKWDLTDREW